MQNVWRFFVHTHAKIGLRKDACPEMRLRAGIPVSQPEIMSRAAFVYAVWPSIRRPKGVATIVGEGGGEWKMG